MKKKINSRIAGTLKSRVYAFNHNHHQVVDKTAKTMRVVRFAVKGDEMMPLWRDVFYDNKKLLKRSVIWAF